MTSMQQTADRADGARSPVNIGHGTRIAVPSSIRVLAADESTYNGLRSLRLSRAAAFLQLPRPALPGAVPFWRIYQTFRQPHRGSEYLLMPRRY